MATTPDEIELEALLRKLRELYPQVWEELYEILQMLRDPKYGPAALARLVALIATYLGRYPRAARVLVRQIIALIFRLRGLANPFIRIVQPLSARLISIFSRFILGPLIAVAAGLLLGGLAGNGCDNKLGKSAKLYNVGKADAKCVNANGLRPHLPISESHWGCSNSLAKTLDATQIACTKSHSCGGSCSAGTDSCVAVNVVEQIDQTPGWLSCETLIAFHCECACR